jgi:glycosyltransferase involved in cell wall biosynthesis
VRCRNTHVIPHGCYTTFRHWADPSTKEIPYSALFFGRIQQYKGLDVLLKAAELVARDIPAFKVIIAARARSSSGAAMSSPAIRCASCAAAICPTRRSHAHSQQASVVVLPYTEGSQSGVVRIAYVFGKPVIVTDVGSLAESVRPGVTGLVVPPRDEHALAHAIVEVLGDETRRKTMSAAAARVPSEDLSWLDIARPHGRGVS